MELNKSITNEIVVRHLQESDKMKDSLVIGTPAKGGEVKLYVDFSDEKGTIDKINKAIAMRKYASEQIAKESI